MPIQIIRKKFVDELELIVNGMESKGWSFRGNLITDKDGFYLQVMCKLNTPVTKTLKRTAKRFQKPTHEEIGEMVKQGYQLDGFFDYYESKGWLVGKSPMKDWKASARGWSKRQSQFSLTKEPAVKTPTESQQKINIEAVWRRQGFKSEREYSDYCYNKDMERLK